MYYVISNFSIIFTGVSCDACLKNNFKGRRYKCLRCYDYDLCASCFESSASTSRHSPDHPVQCILSRSDFGKLQIHNVSSTNAYNDSNNEEQVIYLLICPCIVLTDLYYSGESAVDVMAHSLTCPICGRLGLTETELQSHVTAEHQSCTTEVVSIYNVKFLRFPLL